MNIFIENVILSVTFVLICWLMVWCTLIYSMGENVSANMVTSKCNVVNYITLLDAEMFLQGWCFTHASEYGGTNRKAFQQYCAWNESLLGGKPSELWRQGDGGEDEWRAAHSQACVACRRDNQSCWAEPTLTASDPLRRVGGESQIRPQCSTRVWDLQRSRQKILI